MDALRASVCTLSVFLLIGGCLLMLVPGRTMRKTYRFLLSLMIALLVLSCFRVKLDFDPATFGGEADIPQGTAQAIEKQYRTAAEQATAQLIRERLAEQGVTAQEIFVCADISEDKRINLECVEVILKQKDSKQADKVYQQLKAELGGSISVKAAEVKEIEP